MILQRAGPSPFRFGHVSDRDSPPGAGGHCSVFSTPNRTAKATYVPSYVTYVTYLRSATRTYVLHTYAPSNHILHSESRTELDCYSLLCCQRTRLLHCQTRHVSFCDHLPRRGHGVLSTVSLSTVSTVSDGFKQHMATRLGGPKPPPDGRSCIAFFFFTDLSVVSPPVKLLRCESQP